MSTKRLVTNAMLIAMFYVLSSFVSIKLGNMKFTLDSLPILVGASLFGPVDGLLIGFFGSLLDQLLNYGFAPLTLLWVLPAAVRGLLVGLYAKRCHFEMSMKQTQFITVSTALLVTVLNTFVIWLDSVIYGYYSFAYVFGAVPVRVFSGIVTAVLFGILLPKLLPPLRRYLAIQTKN